MTRSEWLAALEQERMDTSYTKRERLAKFPLVAMSQLARTKWMVAFHAGRYFEGSRDPWATNGWAAFDRKAELITEAGKDR